MAQLFSLGGYGTLDMNSTVSLIIALLFTGVGASWILFPQWAYRVVTPEQAARDRRRFMMLGFGFCGYGLISLGVHFFG